MKAPKKRRRCLHCKVALFDKLTSSCDQLGKARGRFRKAVNDCYSAVARWRRRIKKTRPLSKGARQQKPIKIKNGPSLARIPS